MGLIMSSAYALCDGACYFVSHMPSPVTCRCVAPLTDDSFTRGVFIGSFKRVFHREVTDNNDLSMAFAGELQVLTSREFKVGGGEWRWRRNVRGIRATSCALEWWAIYLSRGIA